MEYDAKSNFKIGIEAKRKFEPKYIIKGAQA
jgi:hypothetical protein